MLRNWIPIEKLNLQQLLLKNSNPIAITFLENGWYIKEKCESSNKSDDGGDKRKKMSIDSILANLSYREWFYLSSNINAISLLEQNFDKINWFGLSRNPNAISLLEQNLDKIDWEQLSRNHNAISLIKQNLDKVNWEQLSMNPCIFENEDFACK